MKELNKFLNEKKEAKKKPHTVKKGEGKDDKKYVLMMEKYKRLRRTDREAANKLLKETLELGRNGDVSKDAKIAGAYI